MIGKRIYGRGDNTIDDGPGYGTLALSKSIDVQVATDLEYYCKGIDLPDLDVDGSIPYAFSYKNFGDKAFLSISFIESSRYPQKEYDGHTLRAMPSERIDSFRDYAMTHQIILTHENLIEFESQYAEKPEKFLFNENFDLKGVDEIDLQALVTKKSSNIELSDPMKKKAESLILSLLNYYTDSKPIYIQLPESVSNGEFSDISKRIICYVYHFLPYNLRKSLSFTTLSLESKADQIKYDLNFVKKMQSIQNVKIFDFEYLNINEPNNDYYVHFVMSLSQSKRIFFFEFVDRIIKQNSIESFEKKNVFYQDLSKLYDYAVLSAQRITFEEASTKYHYYYNLGVKYGLEQVKEKIELDITSCKIFEYKQWKGILDSFGSKNALRYLFTCAQNDETGKNSSEIYSVLKNHTEDRDIMISTFGKEKEILEGLIAFFLEDLKELSLLDVFDIYIEMTKWSNQIATRRMIELKFIQTVEKLLTTMNSFSDWQGFFSNLEKEGRFGTAKNRIQILTNMTNPLVKALHAFLNDNINVFIKEFEASINMFGSQNRNYLFAHQVQEYLIEEYLSKKFKLEDLCHEKGVALLGKIMLLVERSDNRIQTLESAKFLKAYQECYISKITGRFSYRFSQLNSNNQENRINRYSLGKLADYVCNHITLLLSNETWDESNMINLLRVILLLIDCGMFKSFGDFLNIISRSVSIQQINTLAGFSLKKSVCSALYKGNWDSLDSHRHVHGVIVFYMHLPKNELVVKNFGEVLYDYRSNDEVVDIELIDGVNYSKKGVLSISREKETTLRFNVFVVSFASLGLIFSIFSFIVFLLFLIIETKTFLHLMTQSFLSLFAIFILIIVMLGNFGINILVLRNELSD